MQNIQDDSIDIFSLINPILFYRKLILKIMLAVCIISIPLLLLKKPVYKADVKLFIGKSADPISDMGSKAFGGEGAKEDVYMSDFGLAASRFYIEMIRSRSFLERLGRLEIEVSGNRKINSYDFFNINPALTTSVYDMHSILSSIIEASTEKLTSIMTISVRSKDPVYSVNFANALTAELEKFSLEFVVNRSRTKRVFFESKIKESEQKLRDAEEKLGQFRLTNKRIENSPELLMLEERLKRNLWIETEIYVSFSKELEKIKLMEKREISPLIVIEYSALPLEKDGMARRILLMLCVFGGLGVGILFSFILSTLSKFKVEKSPEYTKFIENMREISREIRTLLFLGFLKKKN